jgi:hypothetical protein
LPLRLRLRLRLRLERRFLFRGGDRLGNGIGSLYTRDSLKLIFQTRGLRFTHVHGIGFHHRFGFGFGSELGFGSWERFFTAVEYIGVGGILYVTVEGNITRFL